MSEKWGSRLKALREDRGVSLRELSRTSGLAPASLSAIENDKSSPTLATFQKILKGLGMDFIRFFSDAGVVGREPVFPASGMRSVHDSFREYKMLFPNRTDFRFTMFHESIMPGEKRGQWERHDFDIGGIVVEGGPLRLELEGEGVWDVNAGDAFYIKAGVRHRGINAGKSILKLISTADPPRY